MLAHTGLNYAWCGQVPSGKLWTPPLLVQSWGMGWGHREKLFA